MPSNTQILKDPQLDRQLLDDGYVIVPFLDPAEIESLCQYFYSLEADIGERLYASAHVPDEAFRLATNERIRSVFARAIDLEFLNGQPLGGSYIVKPPGDKGMLEPHQDWNIVDENHHRSFNIWVPLVDVDENNGAIWVLEKSHNKQYVLRGINIPGIFDQVRSLSWQQMKMLPMKAGEALIYDHRLLHASKPNRSGELRLATVYGIVAKDVPLRYFYKEAGQVAEYACEPEFYIKGNPAAGPNGLRLLQHHAYDFPLLDARQFQQLYLESPGTSGLFQKIKRAIFQFFPSQNSSTVSSPPSENDQEKAPSPVADPNPYDPQQAQAVGQFYDQYNDKFRKVYGDVIQAFRTTDIKNLLDYQIESIGLEKGQLVLDAGCGVCGPALYFAQKAGVEVEAVTISAEQVTQAKEKIREEGAEALVRVRQGDYHLLPELFPEQRFDAVYFLESFGHSHDKKQAIEAAWKVLQPGGILYIKDLFRRIAVLPEHEPKIQEEVDKINEAYHYHISDLYEFLHHLRKQGFIISKLKTIDLKLEEFENLTISNDFQELTGIAKIDNWEDYIFPVDFFEIKCHKPWNEITLGNSRYFLQNLYHMKIWGKQPEEL